MKIVERSRSGARQENGEEDTGSSRHQYKKASHAKRKVEYSLIGQVNCMAN